MTKCIFTRARRLLLIAAAALFTTALPVTDADAEKPGFAGQAAGKGGRADEAKEHAREQGKGEKKGLNKDDEETGKKTDRMGKKDKKAKTEKKSKKDKKGKD